MGKDTLISWADSTVNPTTGCDGCELWRLMGDRADLLRRMGGPCYAGNYHETRMAKALPHLYAADFTEVRMAPGRMAKVASWSDLAGTSRPGKPWLDGMPRMIFVGDMGDVFSEAVTFNYLKAELVDVATSPKGRRHIWMVLTKRPARLAEFARWLKAEHGVDWPANIWSGTSITARATLKRIDGLMGVPGVRFLSVEPLVEAVDLSPWLARAEIDCPDGLAACEVLHLGPAPIALVVVGGESRQGAFIPRPFDVQWARDIVGQCRAAGVAVHVKQLGSSPYDSRVRVSIDGPDSHAVELGLQDSHGGDWTDPRFPDDLKVREFPALATAEGGAR